MCVCVCMESTFFFLMHMWIYLRLPIQVGCPLMGHSGIYWHPVAQWKLHLTLSDMSDSGSVRFHHQPRGEIEFSSDCKGLKNAARARLESATTFANLNSMAQFASRGPKMTFHCSAK